MLNMLKKIKCFLVEGGQMSEKCRNVRMVNGRTDIWKNMDFAGGDQIRSNTYVVSEAKSSVSPDTHPQPCRLYPHKPKQHLLEILKNRRRKGEEEVLNDITELAAWMEKPQSGTDDEQLAVRKYCSDLQNEPQSLTQESDALRRERDNLKADFDELKSKCSTLKENLNTILEHDVLLGGKAKLVGPDGGMEMMLDELSSILQTHLIVTRERDTLKLEHEELKVDFDELKTENNTLKYNLNAITEERDAVQRDKDNLVGLEDRVKMMLEELSSTQEAHLILTQEKDDLRSEHDELKVNFEELARECKALKDNLNVIREKCDALQRDKDALLGVEATVKMMLDQESSIQNPLFLLTQERDTLRTEYEELKVNSEELARECSALKDNLNVIREKCDALQGDRDVLLGIEAIVKMMLSEESRIQNPHFLLTHVRDILRSEYKEVKDDFDKLKQECRTLKENLNVIEEEQDAVQKERNKLVGLEGGMKIMLDELPSIENAHLVVTQERNTARSEYSELKVELDKYKIKCSALKKKLKSIREERDSLQREKEKLVGLEGRVKTMSDELSSIQYAYLVVTQERDTLRLEYNELKVEFDEYKRECSALKEDLNAIREERDAHQREKEKLVSIDGGRKSMLDEQLSIHRARLIVTQERATLRSGREELKVNFDELERVYNVMNKM